MRCILFCRICSGFWSLSGPDPDPTPDVGFLVDPDQAFLEGRYQVCFFAKVHGTHIRWEHVVQARRKNQVFFENSLNLRLLSKNLNKRQI